VIAEVLVADPVTELTVLATPAALQSGAAHAVGTAAVVTAKPARRPQPAARRRMVEPLNFIIACDL
jgi:hypothetical protein